MGSETFSIRRVQLETSTERGREAAWRRTGYPCGETGCQLLIETPDCSGTVGVFPERDGSFVVCSLSSIVHPMSAGHSGKVVDASTLGVGGISKPPGMSSVARRLDDVAQPSMNRPGSMTDALALLLVAPPGAGKGTQAPLLAAHYGIVHVSSGALLRKNVAESTRIGVLGAGYLARGDLVPDGVVIEMLTEPLLEAARMGGFVLDGFPRTLRQAEEAQRLAARFGGMRLQAVIHLVVDSEVLRGRLRARAEQEGRADDTDATVTHRLEVFHTETEPLLGFYAKRALVVDVNGEQPVERVFEDIVTAVDRLRANRRELP